MRHRSRLCLRLAAFLLPSAIALGQTVSTQILGLVTDPTGAVIAGATVTAKHVARGDVRTTQSNETGNYIFPLLDIGEYEVSCSMAGFKTEVRRNIGLQLQDKLRLDFQLQVGDQVETIEVTESAPLLRTEDATLGSVVERKRVIELPLNGRNFAQAATLMPGVVFGNSRMKVDGQGTIASNLAMPGQIVGISANGQRDANQNITLDGVVATDSHHSAMLFVPSLEAVEEFKIQSAVYSAEYGMNSGAQANVAIRSGTNELHGTLFEFLRNNTFDARGYFLPQNQDKNKLRRNQYGGVASGPIARDKTFWLFSWEGRREVRGSPAQAAVPTLAMRNGDFSEILQQGNRYYPRDANPAVSRAIRFPNSADPFPNNVIPQSLIHPVSKNLLTWKDTSPFPEGGFLAFPNRDELARSAGSTLNLAGLSTDRLNSDQYLTRIDHRFGDNDRVFGRYVAVDSLYDQDPLTKVTRNNTEYLAQNIGIGYTKILSPTVINDLRWGFNRMHVDLLGLQSNTGFTHRDLGLDFRVVGDNNRTLTEFEEGLPSIGITGFSGISSGNVQFNTKDVYEVSDSVSISRGAHNFKFGGQYRWNRVDFAGSNLPRGQISFTEDIAGIPNGMAAFLIGIPLNANSAEGAPPGFIRQTKYGLFWLDDWKVSPKLTINYGVRYDLFGHVTDAEGRIRSLSFEDGHVQTINGATVPMLVPDPGVIADLYDINKKQIMPRLGIAYRLTDKTVLRLGAGQFFNAQQTNNFSILNLNPPFSGSTVFQNDRNNPTATIDNPFAGSPVGGGPAALLMLGYLQADDGNRSHYLNNDIWQWSAEIERSLGQDMVFGAGYVGSAASNLEMPLSNSNNPNPGTGAVQGRRPVQFYVDSRDPDTLLPLGTVRRLESWTNTNYHSLQTRFERRYSKGLLFNASFNYQKAMAIGYGANEGAGFVGNYVQNPRNRLADYGRSAIDQRLRFVFSHIWEIPWMRNASGLKGALLGGWSVNGIIQLTSGLPVTVVQSGDSHNTGPASQPRPHVAPGQSVERVMENRSIAQWFNTAAFVRSKFEGSTADGLFVPGNVGYGNAGTSLFDAPALKTWDFALFKDFRITENQKVQFRWEAFNFTNSPQFNAPGRSLGGADFGRIGSTAVNNREMQFALKYIF
jgi:hypothetical protein